MKETPAALAEQILQSIAFVHDGPLSLARKVDIINAILTVINPLCNEVARLEAELEEFENSAKSPVEFVLLEDVDD